MNILFASDISFSKYESFPGKAVAKSVFGTASELFKNADFSIINLENVFGDRDRGAPIPKGGPNLISSSEFVDFIDVLSPSAIGLANNHARDFGPLPMLQTRDMLRARGYQVAGVGENIEEAYKPVIFEKDSTRVEIFAICENEIGFATEELAGSAGYKLLRVRVALEGARSRGALPIIYFHGGNERNPYPSPGKIEMYRNFIEMGAVAVVAMHTHCPQGIEVYKGAPIIYSMGNFYFPTKTADYALKTWNVGFMTNLNVSESGVSLDIIPYKFDFNSFRILEGEDRDKMLNYVARLSAPIGNEKRMRELFDSWCMISGIGVTDQPHHVKMVGDFVPEAMENFEQDAKKRFLRIKNLFSCEAHNEMLRNTFDMVYDGRCEAAMAGVKEICDLQEMKF